MSQPVELGSVLGGRYKITALVLTSAEQDFVLNGVDQVLNRPVSILVASAVNASQVAASAREIATGERLGSMQVLDLGIADGQTYLVTNKAAPADLLDLVITRDTPYVEPFFTDTLGSELFGTPRSTEPESYDDDLYEEHGEYDEGPRRPGLIDRFSHRFGRKNDDGGDVPAAGAAAAGLGSPAPPRPSAPPQAGRTQSIEASGPAGAGNEPSTAPVARAEHPRTAAQPAASSDGRNPAAGGEKPKVSLWSNDDDADEVSIAEPDAPSAAPVSPAPAAPAPQSAPARADAPEQPAPAPRPARTFPAAAATVPDLEPGEFDEDAENNPKTARWLVGGVLAAVLIVAIILAFNALGSGIFGGNTPVAGGNGQTAPGASAPSSAGGSAAPQVVVKPEIAGLTRVVPDSPRLDAENDGTLREAIDSNPASYWRSYSYSQADFGGFAGNLALMVELKEQSGVAQVDMTQLNGSGGGFTVLLNDEPSLDGAREVAQGSFTGPNVTIPVPQAEGQAAKAKYVIVNFTELPRLSNGTAGRPFGLRIADLKVS